MTDQESAMANAIKEQEQRSKQLSKIAAAHEYDMEKAAIEKEKAAIAHGFKQNEGAMKLLEQQEERTRQKEKRLREKEKKKEK